MNPPWCNRGRHRVYFRYGIHCNPRKFIQNIFRVSWKLLTKLDQYASILKNCLQNCCEPTGAKNGKIPNTPLQILPKILAWNGTVDITVSVDL